MFNSLYGKISLGVSLVLISFFTIFVLVAKHTGEKLLYQLMNIKAHSVLDVAHGILSKGMLEGNYHQSKEFFSSILNTYTINEASVLDDDGIILLDAKGKNQKGKINLDDFVLFQDPHNIKYKIVPEGESYFYKSLHPIENKIECQKCHQNGNKNIGYIYLSISMDDVLKYSKIHQKSNIILTIFTLIGTGMALFLTIALVVVKPVSKLSLKMQNVTDLIDKYSKGIINKIEYKFEPKKVKEIDKLEVSLNQLVNELNRTYREINEIHTNNMQRADQLAIVGEMAASIAHEIRNPIAGVQSAIEIIKSELDENDPRVEIFKEMNNQLKRANKAITDLLNYAKPSKPIFLPVNLKELVKSTLTLFIPQFQLKKIQYNFTNETPDVFAQVDEKLMQQVFINLILNAIDAVSENGRIDVSLKKETDKVLIKISDNGMGIPNEIKNNIFKPFFTTRHKGTGLGLAICKNIIEQHKGEITFESDYGKGTTFIITLPIIEDNK